MSERKYSLRLMVKGNAHLRDDLIDILLSYLTDGGLIKEDILQILRLSITSDEILAESDLSVLERRK